MPVSKKTSKTPGVEQLLLDLEALVVQMEAGNMPLEAAVDAYRRGVDLVQRCQQKLSAAREDIRLLDAQTQTLLSVQIPDVLGEAISSSDSSDSLTPHDDDD